MFDLDERGARRERPAGISRHYDQGSQAGFLASALEIGDGTEIEGYFQSEKLFLSNADVRSWYRFKPQIVASTIAKAEHWPLRDAASLSLRIDADYNASREFFPLFPPRFYRDGLDALKHEGPVIVFADRIDLAQAYFAPLGLRDVIWAKGFSAAEQLCLMGLCGKGNVITNSTFAWWGAFLNQQPGARVVAPLEWTRTGVPIPIADILCEDWIKVPGTIPVWDHFQVWRLRHPLQTASRVLARRKQARAAG
jgi:hypothetical protein